MFNEISNETGARRGKVLNLNSGVRQDKVVKENKEKCAKDSDKAVTLSSLVDDIFSIKQAEAASAALEKRQEAAEYAEKERKFIICKDILVIMPFLLVMKALFHLFYYALAQHNLGAVERSAPMLAGLAMFAYMFFGLSQLTEFIGNPLPLLSDSSEMSYAMIVGVFSLLSASELDSQMLCQFVLMCLAAVLEKLLSAILPDNPRYPHGMQYTLVISIMVLEIFTNADNMFQATFGSLITCANVGIFSSIFSRLLFSVTLEPFFWHSYASVYLRLGVAFVMQKLSSCVALQLRAYDSEYYLVVASLICVFCMALSSGFFSFLACSFYCWCFKCTMSIKTLCGVTYPWVFMVAFVTPFVNAGSSEPATQPKMYVFTWLQTLFGVVFMVLSIIAIEKDFSAKSIVRKLAIMLSSTEEKRTSRIVEHGAASNGSNIKLYGPNESPMSVKYDYGKLVEHGAVFEVADWAKDVFLNQAPVFQLEQGEELDALKVVESNPLLVTSSPLVNIFLKQVFDGNSESKIALRVLALLQKWTEVEDLEYSDKVYRRGRSVVEFLDAVLAGAITFDIKKQCPVWISTGEPIQKGSEKLQELLMETFDKITGPSEMPQEHTDVVDKSTTRWLRILSDGFDSMMSGLQPNETVKLLMSLVVGVPVLWASGAKWRSGDILSLSKMISRDLSGVSDLQRWGDRVIDLVWKFSCAKSADPVVLAAHESWARCFPYTEMLTLKTEESLTDMLGFTHRAIKIHEEALTKMPTGLTHIISSRIASLRVLENKIVSEIRSINIREEPFVFTFVGEGGCGKSTTAGILIGKPFHQWKGIPDDQIAVAKIQATTKHADSVNERTTAILFDDLWNTTQSYEDVNEGPAAIFWSCIGSQVTALPHADIASKGSGFHGHICGVCSNDMNLASHKTIYNDKNALLRRYGCIFEVRIKPGADTVDGERVPARKIPLDDHHIPWWQEFRTLNYEVINGLVQWTTGEWMTNKAFYTLWFDLLETHTVEAKQKFEKLTSIQTTDTTCSKCKRPKLACKCFQEHSFVETCQDVYVAASVLLGTGHLVTSQRMVKSALVLSHINQHAYKVLSQLIFSSFAIVVGSLRGDYFIINLFLTAFTIGALTLALGWFAHRTLRAAVRESVNVATANIVELSSGGIRSISPLIRPAIAMCALYSVVGFTSRILAFLMRNANRKKELELAMERDKVSKDLLEKFSVLIPSLTAHQRRLVVEHGLFSDVEVGAFKLDINAKLSSPSYVSVQKRLSPQTEKQLTITMKDLNRVVSSQLYCFHVKYFVGGVQKIARGQVLFLRPGLFMIPAHYIRPIDSATPIEFDFFRARGLSKQVFKPKNVMNLSRFYTPSNCRDVAFGCATIADTPADITSYIFCGSTPYLPGTSMGSLIRCDHERGDVEITEALTLSPMDGYETTNSSYIGAMTYFVDGGSKPGYCGAIVTAQIDKATVIAGMHVFGEVDTSVGGACVVTLKDCNEAIKKFNDFLPAATILRSVESHSGAPLPSKSKVFALDAETNTTMVGTNSHTTTPRSNIVTSDYAAKVVAALGPPSKFPVILSAGQSVPALVESLGPIYSWNLDHTRVAIDDFMSGFEEAFVPVKDSTAVLRPLTLDEAINGVNFNHVLNGLNLNTSTGFPFNTKKKNLLLEYEESRYRLIPEAQERYNQAKINIESGGFSTTPFTASLKDELRKESKIADPRQFYCGNMEYLILCMQYLGPVQQVIQLMPLFFETFVGIDPLSSEAEMLYQKLKPFKDHIIAGDFKGMDKKVGPDAKYVVREIYRRIAIKMEYSSEDINMMLTLFDSMIIPLILVDGATLVVPNLNPSGCLPTVHFNGFGISIGFRALLEEDFSYLTLLRKKGLCLRDEAGLVTMGDDHLIGVDEKLSRLIDGFWLQKRMASLGMEYTSPSKEEALKAFYSLEDVDFCQRKFMFQQDLGYHVLAYDWTKFRNSLHYTGKKMSQSERDVKFIDTLNCVRMESAPYGRSEYDSTRELLLKLCGDVGLHPSQVLQHTYEQELERLMGSGSARRFEEHSDTDNVNGGDPITSTNESSSGKEVPSDFDPLLPSAGEDGSSLAHFFKREIMLATFSINEIKVEKHIFPYSIYLNDKWIFDKTKGFTQFRGNMKIRGTITTTPGHYGKFLVGYVPTEFQSLSRTSIFIRRDVSAAMLLPHVVVDISKDTSFCLELPLLIRQSGIWLPDLDDSTGPALFFISLTELRHYQAKTDAVRIQVFGSFENAQMIGLTGMMQEQTSDAPSGVISRGISAVMAAESLMSSFSGRFKMPFQVVEALEKTAAVASIFGLSRPTDVNVVAAQPFEIGLMSSTNSRMILAPMGLDAVNQVSFGPHLPGDTDDPFSFSNCLSKWSFVDNISWSMNDIQNKNIYSHYVEPMHRLEKDFAELDTLSFIANLFQSWRGSIDYKIVVSASTYHSGQLIIYYDPVDNAIGTDYTKFPLVKKYILDIKSGSEIVVSAQWAAAEFTKKVRVTAKAKGEVSSIYTNGCISICVLSPLVSSAPDGVGTQPVTISVLRRAGPDIVFGIPRDPLQHYQLDENFYQTEMKYGSGASPNTVGNNPPLPPARRDEELTCEERYAGMRPPGRRRRHTRRCEDKGIFQKLDNAICDRKVTNLSIICADPLGPADPNNDGDLGWRRLADTGRWAPRTLKDPPQIYTAQGDNPIIRTSHIGAFYGPRTDDEDFVGDDIGDPILVDDEEEEQPTPAPVPEAPPTPMPSIWNIIPASMRPSAVPSEVPSVEPSISSIGGGGSIPTISPVIASVPVLTKPPSQPPTRPPSKAPTRAPTTPPTLMPTVDQCELTTIDIMPFVNRITSGGQGSDFSFDKFFCVVPYTTDMITVKVRMNYTGTGNPVMAFGTMFGGTVASAVQKDTEVVVPGDMIYTFTWIPTLGEVPANRSGELYVSRQNLIMSLTTILEVKVQVQKGISSILDYNMSATALTGGVIMAPGTTAVVNGVTVDVGGSHRFSNQAGHTSPNLYSSACISQVTPWRVDYIGDLRVNAASFGANTRSTRVFYTSGSKFSWSTNVGGIGYIFGVKYLGSVMINHMDESRVFNTSQMVDMNLPVRANFYGEGIGNLRVLLKRFSLEFKMEGSSGSLAMYPCGLDSWHHYILAAFYGIRGGYRMKVVVELLGDAPAVVTFCHIVSGIRTTAIEKLIVRDIAQITLELPYYCETRYENLNFQANELYWSSTQPVKIAAYYSAAEDTTGVFFLGRVKLVRRPAELPIIDRI